MTPQSPDNIRRTEDEPDSRLGIIAAAMGKTLDDHPQSVMTQPGAVIILRDGQEGNLTIWGNWEHDAEAISSAMSSIEAACIAAGLDLTWDIREAS